MKEREEGKKEIKKKTLHSDASFLSALLFLQDLIRQKLDSPTNWRTRVDKDSREIWILETFLYNLCPLNFAIYIRSSINETKYNEKYNTLCQSSSDNIVFKIVK